MSAFYDLASVVLVPSGYKSGKIYAQKPLTTDGQLTFTRASTATRVNASGLIEAVASGVPRLDYTNSTCPKLLLEPQRTNLALFSEQFDNATWVKNNTSISANSAVSPDGDTNADALVENTANASHNIYQSINVTSGTTYTVSFFVKANGRTRFRIGDNFGRLPLNVIFDLSTGTVASGTGTITNYGNGWYRCTATSTATATAAEFIYIILISSGTTTTYTGDGTSGVLLYGAQIEASAYATSYVKTEAAAVTRLADLASKTGISSLIGATEGTLFAEVMISELQGTVVRPIFLIEAGSSRVQLFFTGLAANTLRALVREGAATKYDARQTITTTGTIKLAIAYKSLDSAFYVNGVEISNVLTNVSFGTINFSDVLLGNSADSFLGDRIAQALLFKTRLTNAQLAELTTL
jgi:hypothetical protein